MEQATSTFYRLGRPLKPNARPLLPFTAPSNAGSALFCVCSQCPPITTTGLLKPWITRWPSLEGLCWQQQSGGLQRSEGGSGR